MEETPAIGALPFRCGARGEDSDDPSQQRGDVRLTEGARRACGHWHPLLQEASGQAHASAEAARLSTRLEDEDYLPRRCATGRSGSARQELRSRAGQALGGPDITYVRSGEGFLYLAFILDVCSRKVVGWSMATHLRTELVADGLGMAIARRKPSPGLVHHSDRGVQYTALSFGQRLEEAGIVPSMGGVGSAYDNALAESFVATLKTELLY